MSDDETRYAQPRGAALALILAAERLIAAHGSDIITVRDINEAAGVANNSAVNYHFGSREELILALIYYRVSALHARRRAYLDELAKADKLLDQRSLVQAMIHPLSEPLVCEPDGSHYLRFLERIRRERVSEMALWAKHLELPRTVTESASSHSAPLQASEMMSAMESFLASWREVEQRVAQSMAWLPPSVVNFRVQLLREQTMSGLASIEEMVELGATAPADLPIQIEMLVDASMAMIVGPISPPVLDMLDLPNQS